jgi:hypothetical protein
MWRVIGASVQGTSHIKADVPCQDAHAWAVLPDRTLLAAVADGAGSAALAEVGARLAVQTALDCLQRDWPAQEQERQPFFTSALQAARERLEQEAEARECGLRDLAATLIVVAVSDELAVCAHIGDGATVLRDEAGALHLLATPQSSEYVNETTFLVSADYLSAAQFTVWHGRAQHVALFSDGLQRLALQMPLGKPHTPFFAPLFQFAAQAGENADEQLAAFLRSPRITARADDDLTLVLAARSLGTHAS